MHNRELPNQGQEQGLTGPLLKLPLLQAVWDGLLSNPFACAAQLCSGMLPAQPLKQYEVLPEPIRYRLAHGVQTLSLAELELLTRCDGFCDAALYLTLKMMHGHPARQVALLQEVADHVATYGLKAEVGSFGRAIAKNLELFTVSTGVNEVSGYSKLAAVNRMGPETWGDAFSRYFREFYADQTEPKSLMLLAYASVMGFRHLCHALPPGERAYVVIHKPEAPPSEVLCVEREAHGCVVTKVPSLAALREGIERTKVYLVDDLIRRGDTIRGVRDFLVSHDVVSNECRIGSIWGEA